MGSSICAAPNLSDTDTESQEGDGENVGFFTQPLCYCHVQMTARRKRLRNRGLQRKEAEMPNTEPDNVEFLDPRTVAVRYEDGRIVEVKEL